MTAAIKPSFSCSRISFLLHIFRSIFFVFFQVLTFEMGQVWGFLDAILTLCFDFFRWLHFFKTYRTNGFFVIFYFVFVFIFIYIFIFICIFIFIFILICIFIYIFIFGNSSKSSPWFRSLKNRCF